MVFADCAVTPNPTAEQLAEFAYASAETARSLCGIEDPVVGMLSFSTKGSASHELVDKVVKATEIAKSRWPELKVDGEFQADAAWFPSRQSKAPAVPESAMSWYSRSQAGNIGYKLVQRLAEPSYRSHPPRHG